MNSEERIWAAINLEKADRVPIGPLLTNHGASALTDKTQAQVHMDADMALDAILEVFDAHGGWDKVEYPFPCMPVRWGYTAGMRVKIPGIELPEDYVPQPIESENVKPEDYPVIAEQGWKSFAENDLIFRVTDLSQAELDQVNAAQKVVNERAAKEWKKRNVVLASASNDYHPFFKLSLSRSLIKFTEDLFYNPAPVKAALETMTKETIDSLIAGARETGTKIVGLVEERASTYFYSLKIFEEFWVPYMKQIIHAMHEEGLVTLMHLDTNWEKNLPYFRDIPAKSAILSFDGMTPMTTAKEILGGHLCIQGDVHPSLLTTGSPEEVSNYVRDLCTGVGGDGGFILGVGCEVPSACSRDNFKAMIETAKSL